MTVKGCYRMSITKHHFFLDGVGSWMIPILTFDCPLLSGGVGEACPTIVQYHVAKSGYVTSKKWGLLPNKKFR